MKVTGYCYPWDVEPGFADRVLDLGVDEVAVAVSYHSARAATPWSRERTSVVARHAALYRPVRSGAWGRLRPASADWVSEDSAGDAVAALREAGIPVAAWLVLTHNSLLGTEFPDLAVRNCFGESYPWALCPAWEDVRSYAATLTAEALADLDVGSVVLEACGQLGAIHQHQHEKTDAVWSPAVARLLSVCCCTACASRWGDDAQAIRGLLRAEVWRLLASGDLDAVDDGLPAEVRDLLLATRHRSADELRRAVLGRAGERRVVLHGAADPWATGALPGLTASAAEDVDAVVLPCWTPGPGTLAAVRSMSTVEVGAYVTAVAVNPLPDGYVSDLRAAGADELHLYHLGLAGPARWGHLRGAVREARAG
ncbi:hypothetical protein [Saccharopolyspora taberi]